MSRAEPVFGDMFLHDGKIFRVWTNHHPDQFITASPIYRVEEGKLVKTGKECVEKFLRPLPNSDIEEPMVRRSDVEEFFSCSETGEFTDPRYFETLFEPVKNALKGKGIERVGLTGSGQLLSRGFEVDPGDLDIIVQGYKNCRRIAELGENVFKGTPVESYKDMPEKIFERRKNTMPYKIDMKTARRFESRKPIGRLNNRHVNVTPTFKGSDKFYSPLIRKKDMGVVTCEVTILDSDGAVSVPSTYRISSDKFPGLELLRTNFFFYSLGVRMEGEKFRVRGHLLEEKTEEGKRKVLSLENFGDYEKYFMNIL